MKKSAILLILIFCFVGTAWAAPITAESYFDSINSTTIDFESFPDMTTPHHETALTNQYSSVGVEFSSEQAAGSDNYSAPFTILNAVSGGGLPTSGDFYASGSIWDGAPVSNMRISFLSLTSAFGFYLIDNDFSDATITAYGINNDLIDSVTVGTVNEGGSTYTGISSLTDNISYFIITGTMTKEVYSLKIGDPYLDSTFIDDLSFASSTAPVPEPATFILLGSGLAGLAFYRRKRK